MPSVLIKNIGALVTGDLKNPLRNADSIYVEDGIVRAMPSSIPTRTPPSEISRRRKTLSAGSTTTCTAA